MFWWIDHLIVMFLIRFFGHYWHFCCLASPISDVMIGQEGLGIVFPRPWHWAWLWLWCWHHWHRDMSPRVTQTSRGLGKTVSVTKLSPQPRHNLQNPRKWVFCPSSLPPPPIARSWQWQNSVCFEKKSEFCTESATALYNHLSRGQASYNCLNILLLARPWPRVVFSNGGMLGQ